ncbi:MAG: cytidylate kinase family protein [Rectinemataceae bacterium]|jgi:cytidylate kinase
MAIVTIARESVALGEETARELSRMTGFRIVDRDYIEKRLAEHGFKPDEQQKYDEKKPGFWSSLSENWADYIQYLKLALYEEASCGDCIIMGRGGSFVFRKVPNHLAVRVAAPLSVRVERTMKQFSCYERQALQMVEQCDHNRVGFSKIFFAVDWADPRGYDLTINTARLDAVRAAEIVKDCLALAIDAEDEAAGKEMIPNLLLGQKVLTEIICAKKVHLANLTATAEQGVVTLDGLSNTKAAIDVAIATARALPGVREVKNAIHLVQEYTVFP